MAERIIATSNHGPPQSVVLFLRRKSIDIHLSTRDGHLDGSFLLVGEMTVGQGCEGGLVEIKGSSEWYGRYRKNSAKCRGGDFAPRFFGWLGLFLFLCGRLSIIECDLAGLCWCTFSGTWVHGKREGHGPRAPALGNYPMQSIADYDP